MTWPHYAEAQSTYATHWTRYNEVLYSLAAEHPGHTNLPDVVAKVGIISRSYAAGAERHAANGFVGLAEHLHANAILVDQIVAGLQTTAGAPEVYDSVSALASVTEHGRLCKLLAGATRGGNWLPSFASKYLHFHAPGVPIFDSRAAWRIRQPDFYPFRGRSVRRFTPPRVFDGRYYKFCNQFLAMWDDAVAAGLAVSVRSLDQYLLYLVDSNK